MELYKGLLRPLMFRLRADDAQGLAEWAFRRRFLWSLLSAPLRFQDLRLQLSMAGIALRNPVGLAAGYDKDCRFLDSMLSLGFGYVVGGTVTWEPRPGNPKPRVARHPAQLSLVNAMGFPSLGARRIARELARYENRQDAVLVSIAGLTIEEFVSCHRLLEPLVDGIELNISSPNTQGLRVFQEPASFRQLVERLNQGRQKPLFVKLPPYYNDEDRNKVLELTRLCLKLGVEGVTAINTKRVAQPELRVGAGGLSGKLLFDDMLRTVKEVYRETGGKLIINACGGIFTAQDALMALQAGARSVQVLTALVYEGPAVAKNINKGLVRLLEENRLLSVAGLMPSSS